MLAICQHQRVDDPARVRRRALHPGRAGGRRSRRPRRFLTQLVACYLVGLYLAQVRGTKFGDEIASVVRELAAMPDAVDRVLDTMEPVRALARELADTSVGAVHRAARRLPGRPGGRAQAQGARLHARRGRSPPASSSTARSR